MINDEVYLHYTTKSHLSHLKTFSSCIAPVKQLLKAKNCQNFLDMEMISEEVSDEAKCATTLIQL